MDRRDEWAVQRGEAPEYCTRVRVTAGPHCGQWGHCIDLDRQAGQVVVLVDNGVRELLRPDQVAEVD